MKSLLHSNNANIPNFIQMSLALVQSEIYWLCSVLYIVFLCSRSTLIEPTQRDISQRRSQSAPPSPTRITFADDDYVQLDHRNLRRASIPSTSTSHIRHRPTVHDERKGTTCPPIWWQKTRVKLGRAPVHGDPRPPKPLFEELSESPKSVSPQLTPPTTPSPPLTQTQSIQFESVVIQKYPTVNSPLQSPKATTLPLSPSRSLSSNSAHTLSQESIPSPPPPPPPPLCKQLSNGTDASSEQHQQRMKKFMAKLNSKLRIIPHRRTHSLDNSKKIKS